MVKCWTSIAGLAKPMAWKSIQLDNQSDPKSRFSIRIGNTRTGIFFCCWWFSEPNQYYHWSQIDNRQACGTICLDSKLWSNLLFHYSKTKLWCRIRQSLSAFTKQCFCSSRFTKTDSTHSSLVLQKDRIDRQSVLQRGKSFESIRINQAIQFIKHKSVNEKQRISRSLSVDSTRLIGLTWASMIRHLSFAIKNRRAV